MTDAAERLNVLDLFAGIGGMSLGLQRAGMRIVGQVELDGFCRQVLRRHWPEVPAHDDVRTAVEWWRAGPRPRVDVVAGGWPCQPVSVAGRRLGRDDARWLWPAMADVVAELRPRFVIGENVVGDRTGELGTVLADLASFGYEARAGIVRACEVGAPHARARLFVLAHAEGVGRRPRFADPRRYRAPRRADEHRPEYPRRGRWPAEPGVDRVAYGVPGRVDRLRALGNAVVPAVAEYIGRIITEDRGAA